jgi:hypothetical protein
LFTTQTLGLNPEILENEQIIERLNDRLILFKVKSYTFVLLYGAGCGTDRMKLNLSQAFQSYFTNAIVSKILMLQFMRLHLKVKSNCFYFRNRVLTVVILTERIASKVQSLGYMSWMIVAEMFWKELIRKYYFNKMPKELATIFEKNTM